VLVVVVAGLIAASLASLGIWLAVLGVVGLILVIWLTLIPYIKWRSTHFVVTNEKVITRSGIFRTHTENISLDRITDVKMDQGILQRVLGCGKLALASAGEHGPDMFNNIPNIQRVVITMEDLINPPPAQAPRQPAPARDGDTETLPQQN
jgi:uncharacterized membrane protein YdbT with pleckstrin-like domain